MQVIEQLDLFSGELYHQPSIKIIKEHVTKVCPKYEDTLLNNHVIPLLQGAGVNVDDLKICVRSVYEDWMVVEAATRTTCVSMTVWNNGNKDSVHWSSNTINDAFQKQYFYNRTKPALVYYLEENLESLVRKFFNCRT
ncbi:hypothetical protein PVA17_24255 [Lysinibacillus sp. CNPSo 3705]|uniref:hypothetical protein n=1 Tax=Lysinibacillus sp. CNPSo 3705 TaxID=3028148 RepID=UPI002363E041|nr:hypothetical protein [Lysinibacillus sp. CNPSo 3705]MDD1505831.1 hypothetical protein [Lysinibacillus sp. CNPSo 3705]